MTATNKSAAATACAPSKAQLLRFVKTRNESEYSSNLQFWSDLDDCGLKVEDIGQATKLSEGHYSWQTPHGELIEHPGGRMELRENA